MTDKHENRRRRFCAADILLELIFAGILVANSACAAFAESEFRLSNDLSGTYNVITGSGKSQSALPEGFHWLDVLGVYGNGSARGFNYNFTVGAKATDDKTLDIKRYSLTNLQGKLSNKSHTLILGDTFESFSQYSLGTGLKGASYKYSGITGRLPELILVYGYAYPRWDNLYGGADTKAIERTAMGVYLKQDLGNSFHAAGSFLRSTDNKAKRLLATDPAYDNNQYTLDAGYRAFPGLDFTGEVSLSQTTLSQAAGAAEQKFNGSAVKFGSVGAGGASRVNLEYERVSPRFTSLLGSASPDREKTKLKWRYKWARNLTANMGLLWYRDNLDGSKTTTTNHYKPELGISAKNILRRPYSAAELQYKYDKADGRNQTNDHVVNLNYKDRFGALDGDTNLGYSIYRTETAVRSDKEFLANASLSTRFDLGGIVLKPSAFVGGRTLQDELQSTTDKTSEYSLGLGMEAPGAGLTGDLRAGQNHLYKETGDSSGLFFASAGLYYRPASLAKLNYAMLYLKAMLNDFVYSTSARNFRETGITAGLNIQF